MKIWKKLSQIPLMIVSKEELALLLFTRKYYQSEYYLFHEKIPKKDDNVSLPEDQIAPQCPQETWLITCKMNFLSGWQQILDHTARSVNPQCRVTKRHALKDDKVRTWSLKKRPNFDWCRGIFLSYLNCKCNFLMCESCLLPFTFCLPGIEKRKVYWRITYLYKQLFDDSPGWVFRWKFQVRWDVRCILTFQNVKMKKVLLHNRKRRITRGVLFPEWWYSCAGGGEEVP